ncbi:hypothetical protein MDAP_001420 [Mitosporidium daphniae]|uniref:Uncharacterized protein n=1 Tax=Mitosporidium daphniae TaxID=1485682 RepID=A0A098VT97_9MICR|nr:uncharacterized protein DI09_50p180 [Mitosporidium daphniae]XP_013239458.1 uncharacterized protein DI09_117p70 [Mitosporidium daphniae]KGG50911.1 hypothetical protein DI09_50p180 [Mitosporidium daphniae]KGG53022.1 hypothetical protein DI09_117p70 [Mitosporidium daphniae]|eukprot:XP_013237338.1 uncharacterized protein DI09_50p180 [Mitosporidium daphniae]
MRVRTKKRVIPQWQNESVIVVENEHPLRMLRNRIGIFTRGSHSNTISPSKCLKAKKEESSEKSVIPPIVGRIDLNSSPIIARKSASCLISIKKVSDSIPTNDLSGFGTACSRSASILKYDVVDPFKLQHESILKLLDPDVPEHGITRYSDEWSFSEHSGLSSLSD